MILLKTIISFLKDKEYRSLVLASAAILGIGTVVYHFVEGWNWLDSLYFSMITLTTIGYGDFSPVTNLGKTFTIFYIVIGIGLILTFINTIYNHFREFRNGENKQ